MLHVAMGVAGAVSALILYWSGFATGWILSHKMPSSAPPESEKLREQQHTQDALTAMLTYSPDVAYGLRGDANE